MDDVLDWPRSWFGLSITSYGRTRTNFLPTRSEFLSIKEGFVFLLTSVMNCPGRKLTCHSHFSYHYGAVVFWWKSKLRSAWPLFLCMQITCCFTFKPVTTSHVLMVHGEKWTVCPTISWYISCCQWDTERKHLLAALEMVFIRL